MQLPAGIPKVNQLVKLRESQDFSSMNQFCDQFYLDNSQFFSSYFLKWGSQPMKNWSRQWEYPWVAGELKAGHQPSNESIKILDAGSGCSFFPYYMVNQLPKAEIHCFDYDSALAEIFDKVVAEGRERIHFEHGDLRELPFEDSSFDGIYCISVLEHTNQYAEILKDFFRILKPGGQLVLTMDIAYRGDNEIPPDEAQKVIDCADSLFGNSTEPPNALRQILDSELSELLTTEWAKSNSGGILPWLSPQASAFVAGMKRAKLSLFPKLTVYCRTWKKLGDDA